MIFPKLVFRPRTPPTDHRGVGLEDNTVPDLFPSLRREKEPVFDSGTPGKNHFSTDERAAHPFHMHGCFVGSKVVCDGRLE